MRTRWVSFAAALGLLLSATPAVAQQVGCPWGQVCPVNSWRPQPVPPQPPRSSPSDVGLVQGAVARVGNASGVHIGAGIELQMQAENLGFTVRLDATTGVDRHDTGFRVSPFTFQIPLWQDSLWDGGYLRWSLFNLGADYRLHGSTYVTFDTSVGFGYSIELSSDFAMRVFEIGGFGGLYAGGKRPDGQDDFRFDGGAELSTALVFR